MNKLFIGIVDYVNYFQIILTMFELKQVTDNVYYIESPAKIGLVKINDQDVVLIDTGNDKDAGRKVRKILDEKKWNLKAIYNTHSHADHVGGNNYLQNQTHCHIYIPEVEADFTRHPILEPSFVYGGYPSKELRHKFIMAKESNAEELTPKNLPKGWSTIPIPGHYFNMVAYRTVDNIIFLADCLIGKEILDKYKITFVYDVKSYLSTLEMIKTLKADLFIPSHAEPTKDITELAQINIDQTLKIANDILTICNEPNTFESIQKKLFDMYQLKLTIDQSLPCGCTIRSYLSWLVDEKKLDRYVDDNLILYRVTQKS